MTAYRDDGSALRARFTQHMATAATLFDTHGALLRRIVAERDPSHGRDAREAWGQALLQLDEARASARQLGHSTKGFDIERAAAGDAHLIAAEVVLLGPSLRGAAFAAYAALGAAVPNTVVPALTDWSAMPPPRRRLLSSDQRIQLYMRSAMFLFCVLVAAVGYWTR